MNNSIYVTQPWLPDRKKFDQYVDRIYRNKYLTNNGPLMQELTERMEPYLGVKNLLLVTNGTLALQVALRVLGIREEVITTPFSFIASSSSLCWEGLTPRFADIDRADFCIDPVRLESMINERTSAIVPVHVFGNACDVDAIETIASQHKLKVLYDGAHAFGITCRGKSIYQYGDASTISFHATKLFHSIEGGAIIFKKEEDLIKARSLINFGYNTSVEIEDVGINAKMNEFQAAMGLCVLEDMQIILDQRKELWNYYHNSLKNDFKLQNWKSDNQNYHYFPVVLKNERRVKNVLSECNGQGIYPRRYFHPSLSSLKQINRMNDSAPDSETLAERILCLPLYPSLAKKDAQRVVTILKDKGLEEK